MERKTNAYSTIERIGRVFVAVQRHDDVVQGVLYLRMTRGTKVSVCFVWVTRQIFYLGGGGWPYCLK